MPDQDAVVAITAERANMQAQLDAIWEQLLPGFQDNSLPADAAGQANLKQAIERLADHPAPETK